MRLGKGIEACVSEFREGGHCFYFLLYTLKMEREREESWLGEKVGDGMGEWEERE